MESEQSKNISENDEWAKYFSNEKLFIKKLLMAQKKCKLTTAPTFWQLRECFRGNKRMSVETMEKLLVWAKSRDLVEECEEKQKRVFRITETGKELQDEIENEDPQSKRIKTEFNIAIKPKEVGLGLNFPKIDHSKAELKENMLTILEELVAGLPNTHHLKNCSCSKENYRNESKSKDEISNFSAQVLLKDLENTISASNSIKTEVEKAIMTLNFVKSDLEKAILSTRNLKSKLDDHLNTFSQSIDQTYLQREETTGAEKKFIKILKMNLKNSYPMTQQFHHSALKAEIENSMAQHSLDFNPDMIIKQLEESQFLSPVGNFTNKSKKIYQFYKKNK